jgi:hypothetical protein
MVHGLNLLRRVGFYNHRLIIAALSRRRLSECKGKLTKEEKNR